MTTQNDNNMQEASSVQRLVSGLASNEKDALLELLILGVRDMESLMGESRGVCGLRLNGDDAEWSSLVSGGRFEDWLHRWNQGVVAINDAEERVSANSLLTDDDEPPAPSTRKD